MQPSWPIVEREMRICTAGLACSHLIVLCFFLALCEQLGFDAPIEPLIHSAAWCIGGLVVGALVAGLQKHPRRVLGLTPIGEAIVTLGAGWAAWEGAISIVECTAVGIGAGLSNYSLTISLWRGLSVRRLAIHFAAEIPIVIAIGAIFFLLAKFGAGISVPMQLALIATLALSNSLANFWWFRREVVENVIEVIFAVMYRFRAAGPGLATLPLRGPVIVVCNHSGYFDPMWLAKVLPRTMHPMMTAYFFDVWWMRWAMVYLFDVIRVDMPKFRREAPDFSGAIAALDAGKCLVIFPEGRLRRTAERPLSMFGQGVWHILRQRPQTPVVVCWLEGGWGSYVSYFNGPPLKNKRFDIRHPISIGVQEPMVLGAELLADQRRTRRYLMERCAAARQCLGLEAIKLPGAEVEAEEEPAQ